MKVPNVPCAKNPSNERFQTKEMLELVLYPDAKRLRSKVKETMFKEMKSAKTSLKTNKL